MKKNKILLVVPEISGGGAEKVMCLLARHLDKTKFTITLIVFGCQDQCFQAIKDVTVVFLGKKNMWGFFKVILSLRSIIDSYHPEVVLSFLYYSNISVTLAQALSFNKPKLILSARNYNEVGASRFKFLKLYLLKYAYTKADMVIANAEKLNYLLREENKDKSEKFLTIYNPIDTHEIDVKSQEGVEDYVPRNNNFPRIITVGRLEKQKRQDILLAAISEILHSYNIPINLLIMGEGSLKRKLIILAKSLGIENNVDFIGFKLNPYPLIKQSDIFVLSSDHEGFPNVLLEAMACGTPVISTDCNSGPNEIITDGQDGLLVPVGDSTTMAKKIVQLLSDENTRKLFAEKGLQKANKFSVKSIIPQYEKAILNVIGEDK
ncbi:MAG: glycosyltransferase [Candidatus Omnitrophica bacterium]|nr:glycosyltransferase [Candidatus Omnitrophota bacterium]